MDKVINSSCVCGVRLAAYKEDLIVLLPCQHLIHATCVRHINRRSVYYCPICKKKIRNIRTQSEVRDIVQKSGHKAYYQIYVDMKTAGNCRDTSNISSFSLFCRLPGILDNLTNLYLAKTCDDAQTIVSELLDTCNIKIVVKGSGNILQDKKVIIANHSHSIDALPIYRVFHCGFVASTVIYDYWFGRKISQLQPLVTISRGKTKNTTKKIKEHIEEHGDICIFPEGFCSHPSTLARFRTGAFRVGYPVQPIIVSYNPPIYFWNPKTFVPRLFSQKKLTVTITVLPPVYPPFDMSTIEEIQFNMAKTGNLALSRVSNKDMTET